MLIGHTQVHLNATLHRQRKPAGARTATPQQCRQQAAAMRPALATLRATHRTGTCAPRAAVAAAQRCAKHKGKHVRRRQGPERQTLGRTVPGTVQLEPARRQQPRQAGAERRGRRAKCARRGLPETVRWLLTPAAAAPSTWDGAEAQVSGQVHSTQKGFRGGPPA